MINTNNNTIKNSFELGDADQHQQPSSMIFIQNPQKTTTTTITMATGAGTTMATTTTGTTTATATTTSQWPMSMVTAVMRLPMAPWPLITTAHLFIIRASATAMLCT